MALVFNRSFLCGGRQVHPGDPVPDDVRLGPNSRAMRKSRWIVEEDEFLARRAKLSPPPAPAVPAVQSPDEGVSATREVPHAHVEIEPQPEIERPRPSPVPAVADAPEAPQPGSNAEPPEPEQPKKAPRKRGRW